MTRIRTYKDFSRNDPELRTFDFWYRANHDLILGARTVHKFGRAIVGTSFVPIGWTTGTGGIYRTPTTATALEFVSTNDADTAAGAGARKLKVEGLDANWELCEQEVETNGTTPVPLTIDLTRIFRMYDVESGTYATATTGSHVGDLIVRESGGGQEWARVDSTDFPRGQSEIAAYTVPKGEVAFVEGTLANIDSSRIGTIIFFQRPNADSVTAPFLGAMREVFQFGGLAGPVHLSTKNAIGPFVGPCDIGYMAKVSQLTGEIDADFEITLFTFE